MNYTKDEKETIIVFDYTNKKWIINTNIKKHVTSITKKYKNYKIHSRNDNGNINCISIILPSNAISFRKIAELVE